MDSLGIASVAAITVICYLIGLVFKAIPKFTDNFIPIIMGIAGAVLGIVGMHVMPDFPATDIVNALAVGVVSGLAATGVNQIGKQISKLKNEELGG